MLRGLFTSWIVCDPRRKDPGSVDEGGDLRARGDGARLVERRPADPASVAALHAAVGVAGDPGGVHRVGPGADAGISTARCAVSTMH